MESEESGIGFRFFSIFYYMFGSGQKILTRVRSGQFFVAQAGSAIHILGLGLEISPKKVKFFSFFPSGKKNLFGLGQKVPGSKAVLLFTAVQKKARVLSGQGPSLQLQIRFMLGTLTIRWSL